MAGGFVEINVAENSEAIRTALQRLQGRVGDLGPVWRDIGEYLLLSHDQ